MEETQDYNSPTLQMEMMSHRGAETFSGTRSDSDRAQTAQSSSGGSHLFICLFVPLTGPGTWLEGRAG